MKVLKPDGTVVEIAQDEQKWLDDDFLAKEQSKLPMGSPRAALTYRVSTKQQVDISDDIPMQKIACRKFAQEHGWRIVSETLEKGVSGSKVSAAKRDVIQALRSEAEQGKFDILLVYMFDRLGRIESETPFVVEWFINKGIEVSLMCMLVSALLLFGLLWLLETPATFILFAEVIFIAAYLIALIYDFLRKQSYYHRLLSMMERLDEKTLLGELVEQPHFLEGKILVDILRRCNKYQNDQIADAQ